MAYYVGWLRELKYLHDAGLLEDEDYSYQRAEKITELLDCPRRPWLAWLYVGVPLGLIGAAVTWRLMEVWKISTSLLGVAALCGLAALGRRSRERFAHLGSSERLMILRELLAEDVITTMEFADFEERLLAPTRDQFGT